MKLWTWVMFDIYCDLARAFFKIAKTFYRAASWAFDQASRCLEVPEE